VLYPVESRWVYTFSCTYRVGQKTGPRTHEYLVKLQSTRSSAIAEGPRDASSQLKSCQLPRNGAETHVRQVLNKSKLWSWRVKVGRCVINMCTQPWRIWGRFHCLIGVINKPTTVELCISPVYRRLAVAKFSICSRDPDHAHLWNTHSSQDYEFEWPTRVQNLKSLTSAIADILHGV